MGKQFAKDVDMSTGLQKETQSILSLLALTSRYRLCLVRCLNILDYLWCVLFQQSATETSQIFLGLKSWELKGLTPFSKTTSSLCIPKCKLSSKMLGQLSKKICKRQRSQILTFKAKNFDICEWDTCLRDRHTWTSHIQGSLIVIWVNPKFKLRKLQLHAMNHSDSISLFYSLKIWYLLNLQESPSSGREDKSSIAEYLKLIF